MTDQIPEPVMLLNGKLIFNKKKPYIARIQKIEYLEELQCGELRMTALDFYHDDEREHGRGRGDINEGVIAKGGNGFVYYGDVRVMEVHGITIAKYLNTPILSFMTIPKAVVDTGSIFQIINEVRQDFEKDRDSIYGILIIDYDEFGKRCKKVFSRKRLDWGLGPVTYSDEIPLGEQGPLEVVFRKRTELSYQHEARLWAFKEIESKSHCYFDVGDISDISNLYLFPRTLSGKLSRILTVRFIIDPRMMLSNQPLLYLNII